MWKHFDDSDDTSTIDLPSDGGKEKEILKYVIKKDDARAINEGLPRMELFITPIKPKTRQEESRCGATADVKSGTSRGGSDDRAKEGTKKGDSKVDKPAAVDDDAVASTSAVKAVTQVTQRVTKVQPSSSQDEKREVFQLTADGMSVDLSLKNWMGIQISPNLLPPKPENYHESIQSSYETMLTDFDTVVYMLTKIKNMDEKVHLWNGFVNRWGEFNDFLRTRPQK